MLRRPLVILAVISPALSSGWAKDDRGKPLAALLFRDDFDDGNPSTNTRGVGGGWLTKSIFKTGIEEAGGALGMALGSTHASYALTQETGTLAFWNDRGIDLQVVIRDTDVRSPHAEGLFHAYHWQFGIISADHPRADLPWHGSWFKEGAMWFALGRKDGSNEAFFYVLAYNKDLDRAGITHPHPRKTDRGAAWVVTFPFRIRYPATLQVHLDRTGWSFDLPGQDLGPDRKRAFNWKDDMGGAPMTTEFQRGGYLLVHPRIMGLGEHAAGRTELSPGAWNAGSLESVTVTAGARTSKPPRPRQVLFFTKSSGFQHDVIKTKDGQPSYAGTILRELGEKNGFAVTETKDGGIFTPDGLARFDVLVFYTTGDLTKPGSDKNPPFPPGGKEALLDTIRKGKAGFVGIHSAADTFHSPGKRGNSDADTDPYIDMLGGEFIGHGPQQLGRVYFPDPTFPGLDAARDGMEMKDYWYSLRNLRNDLHVLQWLATWSVKNTGVSSLYRRAPYPITWARRYGKGQVFYTSLGDTEDHWSSRFFQGLLAGAVRWVAGDAAANVKPNISQVTPGFAETPPVD